MMWLVPLLLAALLASGLGLAYVVGGAAVVSFILTENERYLAILPQKVFSQISVFALLSMPLFILAGELMNRGGVTKALIDVSMAIVGRVRGGLGHVNIMTSVFFAGISGSAIADAASLSNTLVPAMEQRGYTELYAGAITAASSIIGPIVPPSIILIFYGAINRSECSVCPCGFNWSLQHRLQISLLGFGIARSFQSYRFVLLASDDNAANTR